MEWLNDLTPDEVANLLAQNKIVLVDVREINEFAASRIPGALLHPLSEFDPACLPDGMDGRPVVFHCAGGKRSAMAAERYYAHVGCDRVSHLAGGMMAWQQAGQATLGEE
ncbi:MAG: rhodanese-like domain-containing protein [Alphaproteobacteria bacterium]